jgi:hypothetical protein
MSVNLRFMCRRITNPVESGIYKILLSLFILVLYNFCLSQDTLVVIQKKWKVSMSPDFKSHYIVGDTIFEKNNKTITTNDYQTLDKWQSDKKYFVFYDTKRKKIMEGIWWSEHMLGKLIIYSKNGQIESTGRYYNNKCGEWKYYRKNGKEVIKVFEECPVGI